MSNTEKPILSINELKPRAGRSDRGPAPALGVSAVTVLVGPNNSGKSLALREIQSWATASHNPPRPWEGGLIWADIDAFWPDDIDELRDFLWEHSSKPRPIDPGDEPTNGIPILGFPLESSGAMTASHAGEVTINLHNENLGIDELVRSRVLPHFVALLDGRQRFGLAEHRNMGAVDSVPQNPLMALVLNRSLFDRVYTEILASLNLHLVVVTADMTSLSLALSVVPPPASYELISANPENVAFQRQATPITSMSDGVQVFVGMIVAIHSLPHKILLIDEPEAFLHPSLSRRLGAHLATVVKERQASLVASTHSADFLMGCIQEIPNTSVVRLTYEGGVATTRSMSPDDVGLLATDPMLRSVNALHALFTRGVVICEGDPDRAFYEEINRRLLSSEGRVGADDTKFLSAGSWQTTGRIARPLRSLGIPAAVILDFDSLAERTGWGAILEAAGIPDNHSIAVERLACATELKATGSIDGEPVTSWKKDGLAGVQDLTLQARLAALIDSLAEYGVFVVPGGEVESWLRQFRTSGKKTWLLEIFSALGTSQTPTTVTPGEGDVWSFVERVSGWLSDPHRLGIHS